MCETTAEEVLLRNCGFKSAVSCKSVQKYEERKAMLKELITDYLKVEHISPNWILFEEEKKSD
jgi:hypothetical protein